MLKRAIAVAGLIAISAITTQSALAQSPGGTLEKIVASKTFAIAYREESVPFSFIDSRSKPKGYAIANGTANAECSSTTIATGRMKQVEFLTPNFITGTKLLVRKGSGINKIEDLEGKTLIALAGTTNEKAALEEIAKRKLKVNMVKVKDHPQALLNLEQGRADAYTSNDVVLYGIRTMAKNPSDYEVVGPFYSYDPFSIMIPKNDTDFRALGLKVMSDLYRSGEIFTIYKKWFEPGPTNINLPMNDDLKNALRLNAFAN